MRNVHSLLTLSLLSFLLSACSKSRSTSIDSSELYVNFDVTGNSSDSVSCTADMRVGGITSTTYVELSGDDAIYCSDGTTEVQMSKDSSLLGSVSYKVTSGLTYDTSRTYTIRLRHSGTDFSATAQLPTPVEITSPTTSTTIVKGSAIPVTWTAATSDHINFTVSWSSGNSSGTLSSVNESDDGSYSFDASQSNIGVSGNVTTVLKATRTVAGSSAPSGLKGGSVNGNQTQQVGFTLVD